MTLADDILRRCGELGFALAGVTRAEASDQAAALREWLAQGKHGEMEWLARNVEERVDPGVMMPGARSIIMVADRYAGGGSVDPALPTGAGRVARYARGDDYHEVMKKRLHALCDALRAEHPGAEFRAFVDTAPVLEREHALRAGLGWIGKHTLLIHRDLGSWLLLGGVLTTLEIEPPAGQQRSADHCGTCTRCIDACPTRAITPYSVDARRCISYLTIEHRGPIEREFHEAMGDWLFGCDVCQEVCPHNRSRDREGASDQTGESGVASRESVAPAYAPRRSSFDLLEVLGWSEDDRRRALAGSAMKRAKLEMWKRNARIVAENQARSPRVGTRGLG